MIVVKKIYVIPTEFFLFPSFPSSKIDQQTVYANSRFFVFQPTDYKKSSPFVHI